MARKSRKNKQIIPEIKVRKYFVGIYARLSYKEKNESIAQQVELAKEFISKQDDMELVDIYIDDGISSFDEFRPAFYTMIEDMKYKAVDCIVVRDFSRFSRDYIEAGNYIENIFPFMGVRFVSINDGYDSTSENAESYLNHAFKQLFNYYYSAEISKKAKISIALKMKNGSYVSSKIPYGYEKVKVVDKIIYKPIINKAKIIQKIFSLKVSGSSIFAITKILNEENADNRVWSQPFVKKILTNKFYTGIYEIGKTKSDFEHKAVDKVPIEDWVVIENHHEAVVDYATFDEVQKIICKSPIGLQKAHDSTPNIFKDMLFCADCKKGLKRIKRKTKTGHSYYYACPTYINTSYTRCSSKYITENKLKALILAEFENKLNKAVKHRNKQLEYENSLAYKLWLEYRINKIADLKSNLATLEEKFPRFQIFHDFLLNGEKTGKDVTYILQNIDDQRDLIEREIKSIETELNDYKENNSSQARWLKPFVQFEGVWVGLEKILMGFVDKVEISDDEVFLKWK